MIALLFPIIVSLNIGNNCIVNSISTSQATLILNRWLLEIKLHEDIDMPYDGEIDVRITDDSLSGPFKLRDTIESVENQDIKNIKDIINWLSYRHKNIKKEVFVSLIDNDEKMMTFVTEDKKKYIQVNGFISCPFIDNDNHKIARSSLALELLDMASSKEKDIFFVFKQN